MSVDKHSKIIDQIKKLFALSKSSNENEAALAFQKAQEIMFKHNIDQTDLVKDQIEDIIEIDFEMAKRFTVPHETLAYWVGKAFMVRPIKIRGLHTKMRFIGTKSDVSVGSYVYSFIINLSEEKAKDYIEILKRKDPSKDWRGKSPKVKQDYCFGFISAVVDKLKKIKEEREKSKPYEVQVENALILVKNDLIAQYVANQYKNLTQGKGSQSSYNRNHFNSGFQQGEKAGIHRGIGSKNNQLQIGV